MLNIDLEKATFLKNSDNTYTVYQHFETGFLKLPRVSVEIKSDALVDELTGTSWEWISYKTSKIKNAVNKLCSFVRDRRWFL